MTTVAETFAQPAEAPPQAIQKMRIFLADDHEVVREGLAALLEKAGTFEIAGQCGDGRMVVDQVLSSTPDVVVLDLRMPGLNGMDICRQLVRKTPRTPVLILSMEDQEEFVIRALRTGARGYLLKESAGTDLVEALRAVAAGQAYLGPKINPAILARVRSPEAQADPYDRLTPRERQVLELIAEGKKNQEIAEMLGRSVKTVDTHRTRLMHKLGIRHATMLVKYAWNRGIGLA